MGVQHEDQEIASNAIRARHDGEFLDKIESPALGEGVDLFVGSLFLTPFLAGDRALFLEACERRIDRAKTRLMDVAERSFEEFLDFVARGIPHREDGKA